VRTFHAKREQGVFWDDMRNASEEYMEQAFAQRRNLIVGECVQLKNDVDSYNDNNATGSTIQMVFDFSDDILEREQPMQYRPRKPR